MGVWDKSDLEQQIKISILKWIAYQPRKGTAWCTYNGGIFDPKSQRWRSQGIWHAKGLSDIGGIWCHRPLFIEVKRPGKHPTQEQYEFLEKVEIYGAIAFWTDSLERAIAVLSPYEPLGSAATQRSRPLKLGTS